MVFVGDLDEAIRFYTQQVGFKLEKKYDDNFACLDMDGTHRLGLMWEDGWEREYPDDDSHPKPRVSLRTDDLDAEIARLQHNGVRVSAIMGHEEGLRGVNFWDNDGNPFFLWTNGKTDD